MPSTSILAEFCRSLLYFFTFKDKMHSLIESGSMNIFASQLTLFSPLYTWSSISTVSRILFILLLKNVAYTTQPPRLDAFSFFDSAKSFERRSDLASKLSQTLFFLPSRQLTYCCLQVLSKQLQITSQINKVL